MKDEIIAITSSITSTFDKSVSDKVEVIRLKLKQGDLNDEESELALEMIRKVEVMW